MSDNLPINKLKHIAIIMDGNRRWAKNMLMPSKIGHQKGAKVAKNIALACKKMGVEFLTLYTFSAENWQRSRQEVNDLMQLLKEYLSSSAAELIEQNVRIKFIGRRTDLDSELRGMMEKIEADSRHNQFTLCLAISYGSRDELKDAALKYAEHYYEHNGVIQRDFASFLYTDDIPDPDLLIRTGGEMRLSNFLLWQMAYTEFCFSQTLWPDFEVEDLYAAVEEYRQRKRKYGE
jgi:undecaprenyl diphosphate synthase